MANEREQVDMARDEFRHRTRKWFYLSLAGIWVVIGLAYGALLPDNLFQAFIQHEPAWVFPVFLIPVIILTVAHGILWHRAEGKAVKKRRNDEFSQKETKYR